MAERKASKSLGKSLSLSNLAPARGSRHRRKRVGFGEGSGSGKTSGRGGKGQTARSGSSIPAGFEGGQMPLYRRLPKVGFTSRKKVRGDNVYSVVSIKRLAELDVEGDITLEVLAIKGLVRSKASKIKILGGGGLSRKIVVEAHAASSSAKSIIEKAGGTLRLLS